jgi:hypothetical protein
VVPACAACNTSKCNDEVTGWMRRKRLDERKFLTRYIEIRAALASGCGDAGAEHPDGADQAVHQVALFEGRGCG